jgi:hypothetical protein
MIGVEKQSTKYILKSELGRGISVEISGDTADVAKITLVTHKGSPEFKFVDSKPEAVKDIAELLLKAVELATVRRPS